MIVKADELCKVISRLSKIAALDKNPPGILMNISDSAVEVYYNSTTRAFSTVIDAIVEEGDETGKIILDYKMLTDIMGYCKGSGNIKVENIEIKFKRNANGNGTATLSVEKVITYNDGTQEINEVVSNNSYSLDYIPSDSPNVKPNIKVLLTVPCEDFYNTVDSFTMKNASFSRLVNKLTSDDANTIYISAFMNGMYVRNTNNSCVAKVGTDVPRDIFMYPKELKAIASILAESNSDEFTVSPQNGADGRVSAYVFFINDEESGEKMAIYNRSGSINKNDVAQIKRFYGDMTFSDIQMNLTTEAVKDSIKPAMEISSNDNLEVSLLCSGNIESPKFKLAFSSSKSGSSFVGDYAVSVKNCRIDLSQFNIEVDESGEIAPGTVIKRFSVNIKEFDKALKLVDGIYTGLDISSAGDKMHLRIGSINLDKGPEAMADYMKKHGIEETAELTDEDKAAYRIGYLDFCVFIMAEAVNKK